MEESIDDDSKISKNRLRIVTLTLFIVVIIILSGLYLRYSYWNIDLNISLLETTDDNATIQCELRNVGFYKISILDPYFSFQYIVETPIGILSGPDAILDIAPSDITLDTDETYSWQLILYSSELARDTGQELDQWPIGDYSIQCNYHTDGKSGSLHSNNVVFTIE